MDTMTTGGTHPSHKMRSTDLSTADFICDVCMHVDPTTHTNPALLEPCMGTTLEAFRKEREEDHANINTKADFIDATLNQLAEQDALIDGLKFENSLLNAELARLTAAITVKGGNEHAPTQWAYDQACAAIQKHRERADAAEARVKVLSDALKIFAFFGGVLDGKSDEKTSITTVVYEPSDRLRQGFASADVGEVELPEGPVKPDYWLFGIWHAHSDVHAAMMTPVIQARHFYDASAALYGTPNGGQSI